MGEVGRSLQSLSAATAQLAERRKGAEDAVFLDSADLALDLAYGRISTEEEGKARAGAEGMFDSVRGRFDTETPTIIEKLRTEGGHRPSQEALQKVQQLAVRRQHQHLTRSAAYEHNERIRFMGEQLDGTLALIANRGAVTGDIGDALDRAEQSIKAYEGILPPAELAQMRERAAKHFYDQMAANVDPEGALEYAQRLTRGGADPRSFEQENPETRGKGAKPSAPKAPSRNDAIGKAANAEGVDEGLLRTFARIESGGDPSARTGSYKGLFQLSDAEFQKYGGGNIYDAADNARAAAKKLKAESARFEAEHGRAPTPTDLYLVHQQGEAGYAAHMANPAAPAWQNMLSTGEGRQKGERWAKQAIWGNIPDDMKEQFGSVENVTSDDFVKLWESKVNRFGGASGGGPVLATDNSVRGALSRTLSTKGPELVAAAEKAREKRMLRERAAQVIAGEVPVDPGSKADQETMDKVFEATELPQRLGQGDPMAAAAVTSMVEKTGYVPDAAMSQLRAMSVNGDVQSKSYAYETAANLMRVKPGALDASEKSRRLKDDAEMYSTLTVEMGLPPETAIQRIDELRTPEFEKRREAMKKEVDTVVKDITPDEVTADYDGFFTSAPAIGGSPREEALILDSYRDLVREHYIRTGDAEVAKSMAKKDLHRSYNVSQVTDKKRLMRHPPEMHYPKIEPRAGKDPDHSYFTTQLVESVKEQAGKDVPIGDIFIEAVPQTNMDIRSGRLPGYGVVWFEERDGVKIMQTAPGLVFRADVKGEQERQKKNREERARYLRQQEVERQQRLESAPERKALKSLTEGIADDIDDPIAERTYTAPLTPGLPGIN